MRSKVRAAAVLAAAYTGAYKVALDRLVKAEAELRKAYPDSIDILNEYQSADI